MHSNNTEFTHLVKFLVISTVSFFFGAMHGLLQVIPSIRAWLDSIGSPYGGPGHIIDPLAHAHINLIGGLVILAMGTMYYLLPIISGKAIYSLRLTNHSCWWTTIGVFYFYTTQVVFGIVEGNLLLDNNLQAMAEVHRFYGPIVASSGMIMATGFCIYLANVIFTLNNNARNP